MIRVFTVVFQSEKLPPTRDALKQAISRAHFQATVLVNDTTQNPHIPSPQNCGWTLDEGKWVPVMTTQLPAPKSVNHLVKWNCSKLRFQTTRCSCMKAGLNCTEMCECSSLEDNCENSYHATYDNKDEVQD